MSDDTLSAMLVCRICGAPGPFEIHPLREMMFGTRERFDYGLCSACGCLQIVDLPASMERHYPANYYSQRRLQEPADPRGLKAALIHWYARSAVVHPTSKLHRLLRAAIPEPHDLLRAGKHLRESRLRSDQERILDVGCGASPQRLAAFKRLGFAAVEGIDPFIPADVYYHGVPVYKRTIDQMPGPYSMVMFHHSLEHMYDPLQALRDAASILRPGGTCLIRIPVMGTYMWRTYGHDWVELDPPRHLYLMSQRTVLHMAKASGFALRSASFDSEAWEIASSIQIQHDIPLRDSRSCSEGAADSLFTKDDWRIFETQVAALNSAGDAGRGVFYLERLG